jgi:vitamin B12 transporter
MNKKMFPFSAIFALMTTCAFAQQNDTAVSKNQLDEVVVSDSKFALSKEKSGKIITKISAEDLKNQAGQSIATILNAVAGVEINGNQSGAGKNLGLFIRGGKSNQVLVLIDGIPVIDASGINLEYDLRLLTADQVESIEIMKGAASTLYGTGAATGVINIKLKKGGQKNIEANYNLNVGTNNTAITKKASGQDVNQGFSVRGTTSKINYFAAINRTETWGMSQAAAPIESINFEEDKFSRQNYLAKVGFKINQKLTMDFFGNFDKIANDYDSPFDNTGMNDIKDNKSASEQFRYGFSPKYKYQKGELVLNTSFNKITRSYNDYSTWSGTTDFFQYDSRSANVDVFNKYIFDEKLFLVLGTQYQFHDMKYNTPYSIIEKESAKFNMIDPYFTVVYNSDFGLNINAGARLNAHSQYGNEGVFNFNPSFEIKDLNTKILGSVSTAFITPSLYQLYSEYGNLDLKPEKNLTIESGFETKLFDKKLIINTVGFYREQKNFIGFYYNPITFAGNYINIDGSYHTKGVETEIAIKATENIKLNANYTYTEVEEALDRLIPKHKFNTNIDFQLKKSLYFGLNYQYTNGRNDAFFDGNTFATVAAKLGSYQLLNSSLRYDLIQNRLTVFANATNILNADFVENIGYSTRGRNFRLGLNVRL